jgi:5-methyltetrahydrofolate--homocysteine methyltransferase
VLDYKIDNISDLVKNTLKKGIDPVSILNKGLIAPMDEVGKKFSEGKIFIPEMLLAAKTMTTGLEILQPLLVKTDIKSQGVIVLGTVKGDLHDIGKNLVKIMFKGSGFEVIDLGVDVPAEKFVAAVTENNADIVALSALLTTTMPAMEETALKVKAAHPEVIVMVGGAPVSKEYADSINADAYAEDAAKATMLAKQLVS